ncbi:MAG: hypothetical protein RBS17_10175 [Coriobacteriia bacterium]|nr:hypothetical protein [Coriobacteriia bacterium]
MTDNAVAQSIERVLSPLVGQVLARAAIDLEARRMGKDSGTITYGDVAELSEHLAKQLTPFVGASIAQSAAHQVRCLS